MKAIILALCLSLATPAVAGDELWRSNGEDDVWVTTRDNVEITIHCRGEQFNVELNYAPSRLVVPAEMGIAVRRNGQAVFRHTGRVAHYDRGTTLRVQGPDMTAFHGEGGDLLRAISSGDEVTIGVRETGGNWAWTRVGTRSASRAISESWCDRDHYAEWRRGYRMF